MKKSAFIFMMWGILFILFNFRLQHVNVLPNFVGYLLCAIGLHQQLRVESTHFERLYPLNYVLLGWSLLGLFIPALNASVNLSGTGDGLSFVPNSSSFLMPLILLFFLVGLALQLLWVFWLYQGIKDMTIRSGQLQLLPAAMRSWRLYLVSVVINVLALVLGVGAHGAVIPLVIVGFIVGIGVVISFMTLLYRCAQDL